jgi:DedD protein
LPAPPPPAKGADAPAAQGTSAPAKADAQPSEAAKTEPPKVAAVAPRTDPKVAESKVLEPAGSKPPAPKAAPPAPVTPAPGKAAPGQAPSAAASADAAPRLEGFAVQVGAFRDTAKLDQARQKLAAAKVPHYTERLDAKDGPLTRLRAGPFPSREAAEAALATIKRSSLEGKVVPLP